MSLSWIWNLPTVPEPGYRTCRCTGAVSGPFLIPSVMALMQDTVPRVEAAPSRQLESSGEAGSKRGGASEFRSSAGAGPSGAKKVPKWMKVGK